MTTKIDWTTFDRFPESTLTCACGATFRSHSKYVLGSGIVSRKPCPGCGKTNLIAASRGDPEEMTIGRGDIK